MFDKKEDAPFIEMELDEEIEGMLSGNGEPDLSTFRESVPVTNVPSGEWDIEANNGIYDSKRGVRIVTLTTVIKKLVNDVGLFLPIK